MNVVYRILNLPAVYNLVQLMFGAAALTSLINSKIAPHRSQNVLEVGAGTGAFSPEGFTSLTVSDISEAYLEQISIACRRVVSDVSALPFAPGSFDLVFCVGLFHHLSDPQYHAALQSVRETLKAGGKLIILDNMRPSRRSRWLAHLLRRLDRGGHVRTFEEQHEIIRAHFRDVRHQRGDYSWCRLEFALFECGVP